MTSRGKEASPWAGRLSPPAPCRRQHSEPALRHRRPRPLRAVPIRWLSGRRDAPKSRRGEAAGTPSRARPLPPPAHGAPDPGSFAAGAPSAELLTWEGVIAGGRGRQQDGAPQQPHRAQASHPPGGRRPPGRRELAAADSKLSSARRPEREPPYHRPPSEPVRWRAGPRGLRET